MLTVNLGVLMDDQSAQINPLIANLQKNNIDLIEFAKRRQWAITNYSVLIYSAIFALAHSFDKTIRTGEKTGLALLAIITWGCAIRLLIQIQASTLGDIVPASKRSITSG